MRVFRHRGHSAARGSSAAGRICITNPAVTNGASSYYFSTLLGSNYTVQFTDSLTPPDWQTLTNTIGTGAALQVVQQYGASQKIFN